MNLDLNIGYWGISVAKTPTFLTTVEALGYRCIWAAEAYGTDAVTVGAAIAAQTERLEVGSAIMQIPARSPAMTAMTAASLDELSGGRFRLGLGVSGPQVVEGWHGVPFGKPLTRAREYVYIVRRILEREAPLEFVGDEYQIPYRGPDATGLGKALKLIGSAHPRIPIYLASIGPKATALTAEIADGWLPVFFSPERAEEVFGPSLRRGFAANGDTGKERRFDIVPTVQVEIDADIEAARARVRPLLALYIGGMGARGKNFYNDLAGRYGYEREAAVIQDLYLEGRKAEATEAVPDRLVDEVALVGPREAVRDRLAAWEASNVTSLAIGTMDINSLRTMAELVLSI